MAVFVCSCNNSIETTMHPHSDVPLLSSSVLTGLQETQTTDSSSEMSDISNSALNHFSEANLGDFLWQKSYAEILLEYSVCDAYTSFLLHDFDKDGAPELIIIGQNISSVGDLLETAYTFRDGVVQPLEYLTDEATAELLLGARTRITAAPGADPGLIIYEVGPGAGMYGCSVKYSRVILDGYRLVTDAHGEEFVDVETLLELFNGFGYDIDHDVLLAAIRAHKYFYINDDIVTEAEFVRTFNSGERVPLHQINETSIREAISSAMSSEQQNGHLPDRGDEQILNPYKERQEVPDDWRFDLFEVFRTTEMLVFDYTLDYYRDYKFTIINEDGGEFLHEYCCFILLPQTTEDSSWSDQINTYYQCKAQEYIEEGNEIWNLFYNDWMVTKLAYFNENAYIVENVVTVVQSRDFSAWRPDLGWEPFADIFSTLDGCKLSLDDLFCVSRDKYLPVLQDSLQDSFLELVPRLYVPDAQLNFDSHIHSCMEQILECGTVAVNSTRLVFICPRGVVSGNAAGTIFLTAPFEDLKGMLNPVYFPDISA